jgi:hypothetical protein
LNPCELDPVVFSCSSKARRRNLRSLSDSPNSLIGWPFDRKRRIHSSLEMLKVSLVAIGSGTSAVIEGASKRCNEDLRALSACSSAYSSRIYSYDQTHILAHLCSPLFIP